MSIYLLVGVFWLTGWLFTLGMVERKADKAGEPMLSFSWIVLLYAWPRSLGYLLG